MSIRRNSRAKRISPVVGAPLAEFRSHAVTANLTVMNLSQAVALYRSGLSLRKVAAKLGVNHPFSISFQLARAGIPRRRNGNAHLYPRIRIQCAICGREFDREAFYVKYGCGIKTRPNPPRRRVCSRQCYGRLMSCDALERARKTASVQVDYR
jgi:hypothetical protein